jgi:hypothetical protein
VTSVKEGAAWSWALPYELQKKTATARRGTTFAQRGHLPESPIPTGDPPSPEVEGGQQKNVTTLDLQPSTETST